MQYVMDPWELPSFGSIVGMKVDPFGLAKHVGILVPHLRWGAAVISFMPRGKVVQSVGRGPPRAINSRASPEPFNPSQAAAAVVPKHRLPSISCALKATVPSARDPHRMQGVRNGLRDFLNEVAPPSRD